MYILIIEMKGTGNIFCGPYNTEAEAEVDGLGIDLTRVTGWRVQRLHPPEEIYVD